MNKIFLCLTQVLFLSLFILWSNAKTYWVQLPMFLLLLLFVFLASKNEKDHSKTVITICAVIMVADFLIGVIVLFRTPATPGWYSIGLGLIIWLIYGLGSIFKHKDFLKSKVNKLRKKAVNDSDNERMNKE